MSSADLFEPPAPSGPAATTTALPDHPLAAPAAYRGTLWRQVRTELRLVFRRRRNLALLVVLSGVPILIGVALRLANTRGPDGNAAPSFLGLVTDNGLFLAFAALTACLPVFLPLAVSVVGGDAIAGEASAGTLRYLLTVPVSRGRLLAVKAIGVCAYLAGAVGLVCIVGIVTGSLLFGVHDVVLLSGDTISQWDGLLRTLGVCVFVFGDLLGLAAIALFFSTVTEVPVGAMAATIGTAIAFSVLDSIPALSAIKPFLLVHHWLGFADLLRGQVHLWATAQQLALPMAYTAIFGSLAWARITSADVTS